MRITQEADYAIRICAMLTRGNQPVSSTMLSKELAITPKFTSKILRELTLANLVHSIRGINGGFTLEREAKSITLRMIIEAIDGPITIRHCLVDEHNCSYQQDKSKCRFHVVFEELNSIIKSRLDILTLADMVDSQVSINELVDNLSKF